MSYPPNLKISIQVIPHAKNTQIEMKDGLLKCRVQAPATEGKANDALIQFLSNLFGISKQKITLIGGMKSRKKTLMIEGLWEKELLLKIQNSLSTKKRKKADSSAI